MVKGVAQFRARMRELPDIMQTELTAEIEKTAEMVVKEMRLLNPLPGSISIGWTWGDAPRGSVTVGRVAGREYDRISVTIYAKGDKFPAAWFEFGTAERFHKSGKSTGRIVASPFFFPVYRANRRRIKTRIKSAVRRAVKKSAI